MPEFRTLVDPPEHLSTERLSAYLDGVSLPEDGNLPSAEAHLQSCRHCADALAGLDAVRALLRRLPHLAPPRSFALQDVPEPRQLGIFRWLPLVAWMRAASAVAAAVFVLLLSLDLLGVGNDVPVPRAVQNRVGAPTAAPAAAKAAAPAAATELQAAPAAPAKPQAAPAVPTGPQATTAPLAPPPAAAGDRTAGRRESAGSAESNVASLSATPANAVADFAPTYRPLRLASISAGILALLFLGAALLSGRRAAR